MEALAGSCFGAALLLVLFSSARAENKDAFFAVGGSLELIPPKPILEGLTSILWKHKGNLVAEWVDKIVPLVYYGRFINRTKLDTGNGSLKITKMTEGDAGEYIVEINNRVLSPGYDAQVPNKVPKPEVLTRPLSCNPVDKRCSLICEGNTIGTGPVTYTWKKGDGPWEEFNQTLFIINNPEIQSFKTFSCRMNNVVNAEESEPVKNPFLEEIKSDSSVGVGVGVGSLVTIGIAAAAAGFIYWKKDEIRKKFQSWRDGKKTTGRGSCHDIQEETTELSHDGDPAKNL